MPPFEAVQLSLLVLCSAFVVQLMYHHYAQDTQHKEYQRKVDKLSIEVNFLKIENERRERLVNRLSTELYEIDQKIDEIVETAKRESEKMERRLRSEFEDRSRSDWDNNFFGGLLNAIKSIFSWFTGMKRKRLT